VHAHRGGAGLAPENTMEAFEAAIGLGVDWIELDVQTCASGELVVIHEPDLARLGGVPDPVRALPLSALQSIDVGAHFGPTFAGARVPTLREVLERCSGRVGLHVEVKEYGVRGDGTARATADLVASMDLGDRVLISSYNVFSLARIRRRWPDAPLGLVHPPSGGAPGLRRSLRDALFGEPHSARWLCPRALVPGPQVVTRRSVERAHAAGFEVHAGVVEEPARMLELAALGVDGIIADRPDRAIEALRGAGYQQG
jgi:glycerophosphoryl diester phosphodiesterase